MSVNTYSKGASERGIGKSRFLGLGRGDQFTGPLIAKLTELSRKQLLLSLVIVHEHLLFSRFKHCLVEEREALLRQVSMLEKEAEKLKKRLNNDSPSQSVLCPLQETNCRDR